MLPKFEEMPIKVQTLADPKAPWNPVRTEKGQKRGQCMVLLGKTFYVKFLCYVHALPCRMSRPTITIAILFPVFLPFPCSLLWAWGAQDTYWGEGTGS